MRILVFTSSESLSGGVRQAFYQARALHERGHDVRLVLPAGSRLWEAGAEPWFSALPGDKRAWKGHVEALFAENGPTIIHAFHRAVNFCAWHGLFWKRRQVACVSHRGVIFRPKNPFVYWFSGIAAVIANSRACAERFGYTCPKHKLHVVPNGLPAERLHPTREPADMLAELGLAPAASVSASSGRCIWGYIGNNNPIKGGEAALRAFARAAGSEDRLIALGLRDGVWRPLCRELGIEERALLLGSRPDVANYLQIMDAFVFSSGGMDSMPNTVMEAMSFGLPVVATNVGGVPEMLSPAALVAPGDVDALSALMRRIADEDSFRTALAEGNRRTARAYTMDARCDALERIYEVCARKR